MIVQRRPEEKANILHLARRGAEHATYNELRKEIMKGGNALRGAAERSKVLLSGEDRRELFLRCIYSLVKDGKHLDALRTWEKVGYPLATVQPWVFEGVKALLDRKHIHQSGRLSLALRTWHSMPQWDAGVGWNYSSFNMRAYKEGLALSEKNEFHELALHAVSVNVRVSNEETAGKAWRAFSLPEDETKIAVIAAFETIMGNGRACRPEELRIHFGVTRAEILPSVLRSISKLHQRAEALEKEGKHEERYRLLKAEARLQRNFDITDQQWGEHMAAKQLSLQL
jgi:hypothetical protein